MWTACVNVGWGLAMQANIAFPDLSLAVVCEDVLACEPWRSRMPPLAAWEPGAAQGPVTGGRFPK